MCITHIRILDRFLPRCFRNIFKFQWISKTQSTGVLEQSGMTSYVKQVFVCNPKQLLYGQIKGAKSPHTVPKACAEESTEKNYSQLLKSIWINGWILLMDDWKGWNIVTGCLWWEQALLRKDNIFLYDICSTVNLMSWLDQPYDIRKSFLESNPIQSI